jgi:hypothetical protein
MQRCQQRVRYSLGVCMTRQSTHELGVSGFTQHVLHGNKDITKQAIRGNNIWSISESFKSAVKVQGIDISCFDNHSLLI